MGSGPALSVVGHRSGVLTHAIHVMTRRGTPLKTNILLSTFPKETGTYFAITAHPFINAQYYEYFTLHMCAYFSRGEH